MTRIVLDDGKYEYMALPYEDDPDGEEAIWEGGGYYEEAMSIADPAERAERIRLFQAAEQLYLQAAERGHVIADLNLGYVYSYDRCEGRYWREGGDDASRPYPREERAFECLNVAAQADIPEACYKLGDMFKHGMGCEADANEAFRWYVRASELSAQESPVILGSVALRLAGCYEEGFGCEQDFELALKWYRRSVAGLDAAVDAGETWYEKALASARAGVKRCEQEIA